MNDKTNLEVIQQAFEQIARAASAAPISMGKRILQGQGEDERLSLLHELAKRLQAAEADRAQRPSISHDEAQELHLAVGWVLQSMNEGRQLDVSEAITSLTRAREISALIVSDTSEERETHEGVEVTFYRGETDNVKVIQIDADSDAGKIRVNLNDGPAIYEGDPEFDSVDDGTIHAAVITELENDLGSDSCHFHGIEAWINDYPNDFWDRYAQPMIEQIKADFT